MNKIYEFESGRLGFRRWKDDDKLTFYRMNSNSNVMQYFPKVLSKEESNLFINKINNHFKVNKAK